MTPLRFKKLNPSAVTPFYATEGAAGMDLTAVTRRIELVPREADQRDGLKYVYGTGLAFEIPHGHVGLLFPRSSIHKTCMSLTNCVGVIDSDYRGEVSFVFRCHDDAFQPAYAIGDRVGQLLILKLPTVEVEQVEELTPTVRGIGGYGSTGR